MKEVKTFACEVDLYRNGLLFRAWQDRLYVRNTQGVYYVGAKTAKEAKQLLQEKIKFGSICVPKTQSFSHSPKLKYKEIIRRDGLEVVSATHCLPKE